MRAPVNTTTARDVAAVLRVASAAGAGIGGSAAGNVADLIDALAAEVDRYRRLTEKAAAMAKAAAS